MEQSDAKAFETQSQFSELAVMNEAYASGGTVGRGDCGCIRHRRVSPYPRNLGYGLESVHDSGDP
jgi:hypothetical protein